MGNIIDIQDQVDGSHNLKVKLDNGSKVIINTDEYCNDDGHLNMAQAYAMTVYSSQGLTIDGDVFVYYTSVMDRANTYVACSRHKNNSHLFVNEKEIQESNNLTHLGSLSKLMSVDNKQSLAVEYVKQSRENFKQYEIGK